VRATRARRPVALTPQSPAHPVKVAEPCSACATVVATGASSTRGMVLVLVVGPLMVVVV
jgi:hypothetical protein